MLYLGEKKRRKTGRIFKDGEKVSCIDGVRLLTIIFRLHNSRSLMLRKVCLISARVY